MLRPMVFPPALGGAEVGSFHDARATSGGNHETMPGLVDGLRPLGHQEGQPACVFVVTRHLDISPRPADALLLFLGGRGCRARFVQKLQSVFGLRAAMKARRTKEHDSVLNALAAKAGHRLLIFSKNTQDATVRTVEELLVFVGQRCAIVAEMFWCLFSHGIGLSVHHELRRDVDSMRRARPWYGNSTSDVRGFAIADRLRDSHPNVHQAEAAD